MTLTIEMDPNLPHDDSSGFWKWVTAGGVGAAVLQAVRSAAHWMASRNDRSAAETQKQSAEIDAGSAKVKLEAASNEKDAAVAKFDIAMIKRIMRLEEHADAADQERKDYRDHIAELEKQIAQKGREISDLQSQNIQQQPVIDQLKKERDEFVSERKRLQVLRVGIYKRAAIEAIQKGFLTTEPFVATEAARPVFKFIENDLVSLHAANAKATDTQLMDMIEEQFQPVLIREVCIPHGFHQLGCLVVATSLAKGGAPVVIE